MNYKKIKFGPLFIMSLVFISICSCSTNDDNPEFMLVSANCVAKNIEIDEKSEVTYPIESFWELNTVLTVKCQGKLVKNFEVKVKLWPPFGEYKIVTDQFGTAQIIEHGQGIDPIGKQITVTLLAEDTVLKKFFIIE